MLFIEWWVVRWLCIRLLVVAVAIFGFWFVRKKTGPIRLPVQFVSALLAICGALRLATWALAGGHVYSVPLYSPNQEMAARIDAYNPGELGGPTYDSVELFSDHGFHSDVVFSGPWESVGTSNLRWKSDSELEIHYEGTAYLCTSTHHVRVQCIGR